VRKVSIRKATLDDVRPSPSSDAASHSRISQPTLDEKRLRRVVRCGSSRTGSTPALGVWLAGEEGVELLVVRPSETSIGHYERHGFANR